MTWSETKLMVGNQAIGEEEGFNVGSDDGFHNLADDWEKANWSVVLLVFQQSVTLVCNIGG